MAKNRPVIYSLLFILLAIGLSALIIALGLFMGEHMRGLKDKEAISSSVRTTIVIDAGHGGEDGGAVAIDGTLEKDLNLEIAKALGLICELNGNEVRQTRTTDTLLYDHYGDLENYKGQKKIYDLKNRLKIANEYESPLYVGIHMNNFSMPQYSGMQIYYSCGNEQSVNIARLICNTNKLYLQKDNNRQIKKANSSIYILDKAECPSVLVECGFMSNERELELLKSSEHQINLALVIFASITNFT